MAEESLQTLYETRTRYLPVAAEMWRKAQQLLPLLEKIGTATDSKERLKLEETDRQELSTLVEQALQGPLADVLADIARRRGGCASLGLYWDWDGGRYVCYLLELKDGERVYSAGSIINGEAQTLKQFTPEELMKEFTKEFTTRRFCSAYAFAENLHAAIDGEIAMVYALIRQQENKTVA